MGEDTCIYVNKKDLEGLYWTTSEIDNLGNRWHWFQEKFGIEGYPESYSGYWTPEDILKEIAGKKVEDRFVKIIKDLLGKDCMIMGEYSDIPNDKNEDDYVDLTYFFSELFDKFVKEETQKGKEVKHG